MAETENSVARAKTTDDDSSVDSNSSTDNYVENTEEDSSDATESEEEDEDTIDDYDPLAKLRSSEKGSESDSLNLNAGEFFVKNIQGDDIFTFFFVFGLI